MLEQESNMPIRLIISPGGQVSSGMAIYDFMQLIQSEALAQHFVLRVDES